MWLKTMWEIGITPGKQKARNQIEKVAKLDFSQIFRLHFIAFRVHVSACRQQNGTWKFESYIHVYWYLCQYKLMLPVI